MQETKAKKAARQTDKAVNLQNRAITKPILSFLGREAPDKTDAVSTRILPYKGGGGYWGTSFSSYSTIFTSIPTRIPSKNNF